MLVNEKRRGDTVIEVILAITVFSVIAVGAIAIMNQGINSAQRSLEITQVRQQIDAQAEALRYIHQTYINSISEDREAHVPGVWEALQLRGAAGVSNFGADGSATCPAIASPGAFVLNARTASIDVHPPISMSATPGPDETPPPYAQLIYGEDRVYAYGIWIEAKRNDGANSGGIGFIDFHIRACWEDPGNNPAITLGTIVRLYDPAV
jgi:type II secretory pathway pseudopilin PulG